MKYSMRLSKIFYDSMNQQIMKRVQISTFFGPVLMNRRIAMCGFNVEMTGDGGDY